MQADLASHEYYKQGLHQDLQLIEHENIPHSAPYTNTCSWTSSAKPSFKAALYAQCMKNQLSHAESVEISKQLYNTWVDEDWKQNTEDFLNIPLTDPEDIKVRHQILTSVHHRMQAFLSSHPSNQKIQERQKLIEKHKGHVAWTFLQEKMPSMIFFYDNISPLPESSN